MTRKDLDIYDKTQLINNMLGQAPRGLMLRELLVNGLEAKRHALESNNTRNILLYGNADNKLTILNTGVGMSLDELQSAADLTYSGEHKRNRTDGRTNRGEGAKVASLRFNTQGLRYRSRKDGKISQVLLNYNDSTGWGSEVEAHILTDEDKARYAPIAGDFTEVTLLGQSPTHATMFSAYDDEPADNTQAVATEIFQRFYDLPCPTGMDCQIRFDSAFRPGATGKTVEFKTIGQLVRDNSKFLEGGANRFVNLPNGVVIEYIKFKEGRGITSPLHSRNSMGRNTMAAIVWRGEMFEPLVGSEWGRKAPHYGIMGLGQKVSILVHLPDNYPVEHDRYRKHLLEKADEVRLESFMQTIVDSRPQWLLDIIENLERKKRSDRTVESKLAEFARKQYKFDPSSSNAVNLLGGKPKRERKPVMKPRGPRGESQNEDAGNDNTPKTNPNGKKLSMQPGSMDTTANRAVPSCLWIKNDDLDDYEFMQDTSVAFIAQTFRYVINEDSDIFAQLKAEVRHSLVSSLPTLAGKNVDLAIVETLKETIALRVGQYILSCEALSEGNGWSAERRERAYTYEALETVMMSSNSESERMKGAIERRPEVKLLTQAA